MTGQALSTEQAFQIDFNVYQVPSALAIDIPDEAAAAMLHLNVEQFRGYVATAHAACQRVAAEILNQRAARDTVRRLRSTHTRITNTILAVGDSITTYRYGYAEILHALLEQVDSDVPFTFINQGRSGYTSTHGLEHCFTQYLAQKPDWVFLKYGVNDTKHFGGSSGKLLVSLAEYAANMAQIIDAFIRSGARLVVLSPTPVVESIVTVNSDFQAWHMTWQNTDIQACAAALKTLANARHIPFIDFVSIFTLQPDPALYLPDGLHPGPAGHRIIIEHVLKSVSAYL